MHIAIIFLAYGGFLMRAENKNSMIYTDNFVEACKLVNDKKFKKLVEFPEGNIWEVEHAKKSICMNQPLTLAHCILQV